MATTSFRTLKIIFSAVIFCIDQSACMAECPEGQIGGFEDSCYLIVNNEPLQQQDARSYCTRRGMDLVAIETAAENDFILNELSSITSQNRNLWIGLASGLYGGGGGGFASSSSTWQSYQVLPDGTAYQEFSVDTEGYDARVKLTSDLGQANNSYEIALGAKKDTLVTISRCTNDGRCIRRRKVMTPGLFRNTIQERVFAVKCFRDRVSIQTIDGNDPKLYLIAQDNDPISCNYIGFASGSGSYIQWSYWRHFTWSSVGNAKYMNWVNQSPRGRPGELDRCVVFKPDTGTWKDISCNQRKPFICEFIPTKADYSQHYVYYDYFSQSIENSASRSSY